MERRNFWVGTLAGAVTATVVAVGAFFVAPALAQTPVGPVGGWGAGMYGGMMGGQDAAWHQNMMGGQDVAWHQNMMGGQGACPGGIGDHQQHLVKLAGWLGITPAQLQSELPGKSLAQVAEAHGKTRDELIGFMTTLMKESLDQAVAAGRITQEQANQMIQHHASMVGQMVDMVHSTSDGPGRGPGGGPRGGRMMGGWGW